MTQKSSNHQLALSADLTAKTSQLCPALASGTPDILELVTHTTAGLLDYARLRPLADASAQARLI